MNHKSLDKSIREDVASFLRLFLPRQKERTKEG